MRKVAIIMAGGKGERLWPVSTPERPKQFLPILHPEKTMIQLTAERILPIINYEYIFVVTNEAYGKLVNEQLPKIPIGNVILEPASKNTAPCIGLATGIIKNKFKNALVVVLASDHAISDNGLFLSDLEKGFNEAENNSIITIGIRPNRIETDYGYIKVNDSDSAVNKAEQFVEKPDYDTAKNYLASGNYVWNSGMFIWKNSVIESCFQKYAKEIFELTALVSKKGKVDNDVRELFKLMPKISIDHAIMEHAKDIYNIPASFEWDDTGSWPAIERLSKLNLINESVMNRRHT